MADKNNTPKNNGNSGEVSDRNVAVTPKEGKPPKTPMSAEKKKSLIILAVVIAFLLLALIPIIITFAIEQAKPEDTPDTGATFLGKYEHAMEIGYDRYEFIEGNKVIVTTLIDDSETELTYDYVIAREGGKEYLKLTDAESGKVESYSFEVGSMKLDKYRCSKENCDFSKPKEEGSDKCECGMGTLELYVEETEILSINNFWYKKLSDD